MNARPADTEAARPVTRSGRERARRAVVWLLPFLIALAGYLFAYRQFTPPFTGDEPTYALEAFSWALDGDRDLTNDYDDVSRIQRVTGGVTLQAQAYQFTPGGPLISYHGAGLPLILIPAAKLGGTLTALQIELIVIAAIGAQLLFSILAKLGRGSPWLRWAVWAAVVFSLPLVAYSSRLYPEMPGAVLLLGAVRLLMADRFRWPQAAGAALLAAALPWFHARFAIVAAAVVVAIGLRLWQQRGELRPGHVATALGVVVAVLVVSAVGLSLTNHAWYGSSSLTAQLQSGNRSVLVTTTSAGQPTSSDAATAAAAPAPDSGTNLSEAVSLAPVFGGMMRELLSSRNGWLPFAPVGLLAIAGAVALAARGRWWMAYGTLAALAYTAQIASTDALPGFSVPGRFEIILLPLIAAPLLLVVRAVRWSQVLFWPLAAIGALITVFGVTHATGLVQLTPGDARADIGAANAFLRPFPVLSREPDGRAAPEPLPVCGGATDGVRCRDGVAASAPGQAGTLLRASRPVDGGELMLVLYLERTTDGAPDAPAVTIELLHGGTPFLTQALTVSQIPRGQPRGFVEQFRTDAPARIGLRVTTTGAVGLRASEASIGSSIDPSTGLAATGPRVPDLPAVIAWLAVVAALAAALAASLPPRGQRP